MVVVDGSGDIVFLNRQTEALFGYSRSDLIGGSLETLIPERLRSDHERHRHRYAAAPALRPMGTNLDLLGRRKDGSEFPVEISLSPLQTEGGTFTSAAIRDITAKKHIEEKLRQARAEAEEASRSKTRFLAAASHDLRQPLQAALMYANVLDKELAGEESSQTLVKLTRSLDALRQLFNRLLDISKLDASLVSAEKMNLSLTLLFERLGDEFEQNARERGLDLRVVSSSLVVRSDPQLLAQLLQNLLSNALRYTDRGRVLLGCRRRGANVLLQVWDTGIGIAEEQIEFIFDEFYQIEDTSRGDRDGLGLGLAIVQRLAALLGHTVKVQSTLGHGTVFEVSVPLVDRPQARPNRTQGPPSRRPKGRILIIEDHPAVLDACKLSFEVSGHEVLAASDLDSALLQLENAEEPDMIVADYQIGRGTTGIQAIEKIRSLLQRPVPAVLVTGDSSISVAHDSKGVEIPVLHKPVEPSRLHELLEDVLEHGEG